MPAVTLGFYMAKSLVFVEKSHPKPPFLFLPVKKFSQLVEIFRLRRSRNRPCTKLMFQVSPLDIFLPSPHRLTLV